MGVGVIYAEWACIHLQANNNSLSVPNTNTNIKTNKKEITATKNSYKDQKIRMMRVFGREHTSKKQRSPICQLHSAMRTPSKCNVASSKVQCCQLHSANLATALGNVGNPGKCKVQCCQLHSTMLQELSLHFTLDCTIPYTINCTSFCIATL